MSQVVDKSFTSKLMGEWSWSRNILWLISVACLVDALMVSGQDYQAFIRDGAFHAALLIGMAGYLSELRYRFFLELRNDQFKGEHKKAS